MSGEPGQGEAPPQLTSDLKPSVGQNTTEAPSPSVHPYNQAPSGQEIEGPQKTKEHETDTSASDEAIERHTKWLEHIKAKGGNPDEVIPEPGTYATQGKPEDQNH